MDDLLWVIGGLGLLYYLTTGTIPIFGSLGSTHPALPPGLAPTATPGGTIDPTGQYNAGCTTYHQALTGLDQCSMAQAVWCSWIGAYGPDPTYWPDPNFVPDYWVNINNHYGAYGDNICRAGWNRYMECRMLNIQTSAADYDTPAMYNQSNTVLPSGLAGMC